MLQFRTQLLLIQEGAVAGEGKFCAHVTEVHGLKIGRQVVFLRNVETVSQGVACPPRFEFFHFVLKYRADHAKAFLSLKTLLIAGVNAAAFLSPVLQGVKAVIGFGCGLIHVIQADKATFVMHFLSSISKHAPDD